jgi:hypothetical protein
MTRRDKIGIAGLIALFVTFTAALVWTAQPRVESHDPSESFFVQQRIRNLEKSR